MKNVVLFCVAILCGGLIMGCGEEKKPDKVEVKLTTDDGHVRCSVDGCEKHAVCMQELTREELKEIGLEQYALPIGDTGVFRCFCETHGKERKLYPVSCHVCGAPAVKIPYQLFGTLGLNLPGYYINDAAWGATYLIIHLPVCEKHRDVEAHVI